MCKIDTGIMTLHRITMERHIKDEQDSEYLQSLQEDEMKEILRRIEELELKEKEPNPQTSELNPKPPPEDPKPTLQELRALRLAHFKS